MLILVTYISTGGTLCDYPLEWDVNPRSSAFRANTLPTENRSGSNLRLPPYNSMPMTSQPEYSCNTHTCMTELLFPLQVRLQAQVKPAPGEKPMFTGAVDCAHKTVKNEVCVVYVRKGQRRNAHTRTLTDTHAHKCTRTRTHAHTFTGLYRGMLAPLLAITPLKAVSFLSYGIGKRLQQRTPTEVLT